MKNQRSETDFLEESEALTHMRLARAQVLFVKTVFALVLSFVVWASFARLDEMTRGQGEVIPSMSAQLVQSLEGGILQELLVREGDTVRKDQVLFRLKDVAFASEERGTEAKVLALQLRKARLEAEAQGKTFAPTPELKQKAPKLAETEEALYISRQKEYQNALTMLEDKIKSISAQIEELKSQIARDQKNVGLLQKELTITSRMVAQKAMPQIEEIRLQRALNDANGSLRAAQEKMAGLAADQNAARKQRDDQADKFRSQALGELNETQTELTGFEESLRSIGDRVDRAEIRSPVDGTVNNIAVKTIGGIVEPAMKLAEIIPAGDDLRIRAQIAPQDIAFLRVGQKVRVHLTAYDSARYGFLSGELVRVGANSLKAPDGNVYFEAEVKTDKSHFGEAAQALPITSGMTAEIFVITGQKTVLEYLMKPVLRLKDRAFTER